MMKRNHLFPLLTIGIITLSASTCGVQSQVASSAGKLYIHSAGRSTTRWMSDDQHGTHIIGYAESIGLGVQKYNLVNIDK